MVHATPQGIPSIQAKDWGFVSINTAWTYPAWPALHFPAGVLAGRPAWFSLLPSRWRDDTNRSTRGLLRLAFNLFLQQHQTES